MPPSRMNHETLMTESRLGAIWNNASSSELKQQKQFPLPAFSKEENRFFPRGTPSTKPWNRGGAASYRNTHFRGQTYCPSRPFRGTGRAKYPSPINPPEPVRNPPAGTGMSLELSLMPTVSKQHISGRIAYFYQNWQSIINDPWFLETVVGYMIEFLESLLQTYIPSMHASEEARELKDQKVLSPTKTCYSQGLEPNGPEPN